MLCTPSWSIPRSPVAQNLQTFISKRRDVNVGLQTETETMRLRFAKARRGIVPDYLSRAMERLILFDIDGTLTRTQNGYIPFNEAILKTFGVAGDIRSVVPDGNTDPLIVEDILRKAEVEIVVGPTNSGGDSRCNLRELPRALPAGTTTVRRTAGAPELLLRRLSAQGSFTPAW